MRPSAQKKLSQYTTKASLYVWVFGSLPTKFFVGCFMLILFLQPLAHVYANTESEFVQTPVREESETKEVPQPSLETAEHEKPEVKSSATTKGNDSLSSSSEESEDETVSDELQAGQDEQPEETEVVTDTATDGEEGATPTSSRETPSTTQTEESTNRSDATDTKETPTDNNSSGGTRSVEDQLEAEQSPTTKETENSTQNTVQSDDGTVGTTSASELEVTKSTTTETSDAGGLTSSSSSSIRQSTTTTGSETEGGGIASTSTENTSSTTEADMSQVEVSDDTTLEPFDSTATNTTAAPEDDSESQEVTTESVDDLIQSSSTPSTTIVYVPVPNNNYEHQFERGRCVGVGDGSYYCQEPNGADTLYEHSAYEKQDNDGDYEIYIPEGNSVRKLSDNLLDDRAPFYDQTSHTVVWHRLTEGTYEIILYNLKRDKEIQLTKNDVNDMEPTHFDTITVWQRWVGGDWEIMMYDGEEEVQITDNDIHDVAPSIRDGYIIWHTSNGKEQHVAVYEIKTGLTTVVEDDDRGSVINPRFVLVYDMAFDNGDTITKGYDFKSKEVIPLASTPPREQEELPEPEATGEVRALLQNKQSQERETARAITTGAGNGSSTPPVGGVTTSTNMDTKSTSSADHIVTKDEAVSHEGNATTSTTFMEETTKADQTRQTSSTTATDTTVDLRPSAENEIELTEFDVIVPSYSSTTVRNENGASSTDSIE